MKDTREELGAKRAKGNYVGAGKRWLGGGESHSGFFSLAAESEGGPIGTYGIPLPPPSSSFLSPSVRRGRRQHWSRRGFLFLSPPLDSPSAMRQLFFCSFVPESRCRLKNPLFSDRAHINEKLLCCRWVRRCRLFVFNGRRASTEGGFLFCSV